jgi:hypothetical protein
MEPFSTVPAEILVSILEACNDFASLDGLLRTSARVDQVFGEYYQTITDQVMKNCPIISQGLQYAFRNIALLESDSMFTPSTLPELGDDRYSTSVMPLALPAGCSLEGVRKAVDVATSIHRAAFACIDVLLERFSAAEPRRVINDHGQAYEWVVGRSSEPPQNERFHVKYYPPSWAEIYRTHRILWTLAIFDCILDAANTRWEWSLEDKGNFIEQYVKKCRPPWRAEELKTIAECLSDIYPNETITLDNRCPFLVTVSSPENMPSTAPAHSLIPDSSKNSTEEKDWERIYWKGGGPNAAIGTHRSICLALRSIPKQPLKYVNFRAFRRLGIPIWDDWRLHLMGLVKRPEDRFCPDSSVFEDLPDPKGPSTIPMSFALFTWRSLAEKNDINEKFIPADLPDCRFF